MMERFSKNYKRMGYSLCQDRKRSLRPCQQELTFYQANQRLKKQVKESRKTCSRPIVRGF